MALVAAALCHAPVWADRFTYVDESGKTVEVEARLAGTGRGSHALELADGRILLVPQRAVTKHDVAPGPEPLSDKAIVAKLTEEFGEEKFRARRQKPYVIGLVLSSPLPKRHEPRADAFLKKAAQFMRSVDSVFLTFAKRVRFPIKPPKFPMVVLIFESNADFEWYARKATGEKGVTADAIAGFYSGLTNYLVIRLSECHTFATPLHEAIHQQVFNRQVFQRLAPIPTWFNEGIAVGFEGNGERINIGPTSISPLYARLAKEARQIDWQTVVANDRAFHGNALVSEAYAHAWSLHWLLVTEYKVKYMQYAQILSEKQTLAEEKPTDRVREFETIFGKSVPQMQAEFREALRAGIRKQRIKLDRKKVAGVAFQQTDLAEYRISAVRRSDLGDVMVADGKLKNISPLRPMSFHVSVETDSGNYADWHVHNLDVYETVSLKTQFAKKLMKNAPGGPSHTFRVRVRCVPADSDEAKRWQRGELPVPVFGQ